MISKAARRYSNALYSIAEEKSRVSELAKDFTYVLDLIRSNRELELFFQSPVINNAKKVAAVKEIFGNKTGDMTMNFLYLLIKRGRESLTKDIMTDFLNLKKEKEGILDVSVKSAITLSDDEKKSLSQKIDEYTGKKSDMKYEVDKSIVGGFIANINDTILDASIRRQLEILRDKFRSGDYSLN
jgi:F-type H+-transporting ATPase subunit delta